MILSVDTPHRAYRFTFISSSGVGWKVAGRFWSDPYRLEGHVVAVRWMNVDGRVESTWTAA